MEKNGLQDRRRERKVGLWVFGISFFFLISFFLVPLLQPTGSIPDLGARANALDYATIDGPFSNGNTPASLAHEHDDGTLHYHEPFAWSELDPYSAFMYMFGDLNCHNKHERTWQINGNQMPVCTRDVGIFFGLAVGGLVFSRYGHNRWTLRDTSLSILPDTWVATIYRKNYRTYAWLGFSLLLCLPLVIDGFTQLLTQYESNNFTRPLTGVPFGAVIALFTAAAYSARPHFFRNAAEVVLPANAKFQLMEEE
ncbi:MAG: hypothetical protein CMA63_01780 [Euryarchaeota archaeon]|nr:hypothetical protein [Euryarchaeota archaeon]|tara:strand:+ start:2133 stop:2891 length:759 start_codon:yes stop_codon:yes gene_type:complete